MSSFDDRVEHFRNQRPQEVKRTTTPRAEVEKLVLSVTIPIVQELLERGVKVAPSGGLGRFVGRDTKMWILGAPVEARLSTMVSNLPKFGTACVITNNGHVAFGCRLTMKDSKVVKCSSPEAEYEKLLSGFTDTEPWATDQLGLEHGVVVIATARWDHATDSRKFMWEPLRDRLARIAATG